MEVPPLLRVGPSPCWKDTLCSAVIVSLVMRFIQKYLTPPYLFQRQSIAIEHQLGLLIGVGCIRPVGGGGGGGGGSWSWSLPLHPASVSLHSPSPHPFAIIARQTNGSFGGNLLAGK